MKKFVEMNVYESAVERIHYIFDEFENVVISFSGGKDSGVVLNLALEIAKERNELDKLIVYHMDYEAQYQETTDFVTQTFESLPEEVKKHWVCLPVIAQCSTSMFQNYWQPWKREEQNIWCRELPQYDFVISEDNFPWDFDYEVWDYDFNDLFAKEIQKEYGKTAFLIGIRTQESLHRFKAVTKDGTNTEYKKNNWTTKVNNELINAYPIYDWLVDDVWIAHAKFGWRYNKLYDLMYQAGVPINAMRVASPFNDSAQDSLKLYKILDPNNWGKLIGRVNGVNFTALYGGTTAMGWRNIKKPEHFTWKEYMEFLLETLPQETRENYERKLATSIKYWTEDGGALPVDVIEELEEKNKHLEFENHGKPKNNRRYKKPYEVLKFNEYLDDVEVSDWNLLPTYKRMCVAILKNDTSCKTLGFGQTKEELRKRKEAIEKYENIL